MSYCYEKGIPHGEFLTWSPDDRAKLVAYVMEKAERCTMCGTADWEWEDDRRAYTPVEHFCVGCYLKSQLERDNEGLPGTTIELIPTKGIEAARRLVADKRKARAGRE